MEFDSGKEPVSWFQKEYKEGNITLRPPYQRKPVWAARQKCYLIESILLGLPVPEIFIHETTSPDGKTEHAIVDGQQRIRTVLQFIGLSTHEEEEQEFIGFALDKLDQKGGTQSPYFGRRFVDLGDEERAKFYKYKFHIRFLHTNEELELRNMFARLNRYLTALNAQELRHATYLGPFAKLAENLAEDEYWLKSGLISKALVRRLGDIEFVSQLLIGVIHGPAGGSASVVDEYYRTYEDYDVDEGFPDQRRVTKLFKSTLSLIQQVFPDLQDSESRWSNRTDFYSLFVALADVLRQNDVPKAKVVALRIRLEAFGAEVDRIIAKETIGMKSPAARRYAEAVEKGANEKSRRADRHHLLVELIDETLVMPASLLIKVARKKR
jgi:hypothetical protein